MTAQILLSGALCGVYLYALLQRPQVRLFRMAITAICLVGSVVVWMPDLSTVVAHRLKIGRGADLITYIWILLSLLIAINVHVRLRLEAERTTQLARAVALLEASLRPPPPSSGSPEARS